MIQLKRLFKEEMITQPIMFKSTIKNVTPVPVASTYGVRVAICLTTGITS